jgi:flagellar basal body-associated protein FliL
LIILGWTPVADVNGILVILIIVMILMVICSGVIFRRFCWAKQEETEAEKDDPVTENDVENKYYEII